MTEILFYWLCHLRSQLYCDEPCAFYWLQAVVLLSVETLSCIRWFQSGGSHQLRAIQTPFDRFFTRDSLEFWYLPMNGYEGSTVVCWPCLHFLAKIICVKLEFTTVPPWHALSVRLPFPC